MSKDFLKNKHLYYQEPLGSIFCGDWIEVMRQWPDDFVQCVITSPPYWGLRDYGTATWEGGDSNCKHYICGDGGKPGEKQKTNSGSLRIAKNICPKCGAKRTDRQLGIEKTPEEYIEKMVVGFREVRRILRPDGVMFLNIGDSYTSGSGGYDDKYMHNSTSGIPSKGVRGSIQPNKMFGLPSKNLCLMPHRIALALQADGWWVRMDIVWAKPNPMPESCKDRPTKSHEYIFQMTKSAKYHWDQEAVREPQLPQSLDRAKYAVNKFGDQSETGARLGKGIKGGNTGTMVDLNLSGRNLRSVWTIPTQSCSFAHFATFPDKLVNKCILAGTSPKACGVCRAPYARVVERFGEIKNEKYSKTKIAHTHQGGIESTTLNAIPAKTKTLGFRPTCDHNNDTGRCIVFDPFCGSGQTLKVAKRFKHNFIGIDLNKEYCDISIKRLSEFEMFKSPAGKIEPNFKCENLV